MAESGDRPKILLMKVQEESKKAGLKLDIKKMKIMASSPTTSWQMNGETMQTLTDFIFLGSKITADGDCSHKVKRRLVLGGKAMTNLVQFSSVQLLSHVRLCDPMNHSMPGLPVHHQLPEFTQTHVFESVMSSNHLILCHPLLFLSPIPPSISLFQRVSSSHQVVKVLEFQLQHQSFQ